jgi:hypothetical protein
VLRESIAYYAERQLKYNCISAMAIVHNAGKLKFGAEKKGKKEKSVFEQLDTLELAANGPREHI